jgi:hypothetical protein
MSRSNYDGDDLQSLRAQVLEDLSLAGAVFEQYHSKKWQSLETWAGNLLDAMLASQGQTATQLRHPNWSVRLTALLLLDDRWHAVPSIADAYADMVMTDSVSVIRGVALRLLTDCVRSDSLPELPERVRHLTPLVLDPAATDEETGQARSAVLGMLRDIAKVKVADRNRRREELQQLAGSLEDGLLHDRSVAVASLQHPDPRIRRAALRLFEAHWKPPTDFDQICIRLVSEDADTLVRCTALTVLLMTKVGQDDPVLGTRLAAFVEDAAQPLDLRELAYYWLFRMRHSDALPWRSLPRDPAGFAATIDWSLVRSFSQAKEG